MKKYLPTVNLFLNIITLFFIFYFFNKLTYISNNFSINRRFNESVIDVNWINSRFSDNFNLILTTITVLFVVGSYFTYISITDRFGYKLSVLNKSINRNEREWNRHKNELNLLKSELNYQLAYILINEYSDIINKNKSKISLTKKEQIDLIEKSIIIISKLLNSIFYSNDIHSKYYFYDRTTIKIYVQSIKTSLISNDFDIVLENIDIKTFKDIKSKIDNLCYDETIKDFSFIYSLIKFKNEQ